MKRITIILVLLCLVSCSSVADKEFIKVNRDNAKLMLPDLVKYISEDKKIDAEQQNIRVKAIIEWQDLIEASYTKYTK